ncbi:MAG TPA: sugar-binding domain-containing protein [Anaerolineaceae bacterium]|jgi:deoxyribonucleoside regulator|nr:sugar-binding domain-containing protein [Anaerolineaceae bacterium]
MRVKLDENRDDLLAYVAELYYDLKWNQEDIAKEVGVTRSMVSRMLSEAREKKFVEITVHRPLSLDIELMDRFKSLFDIEDVQIVHQSFPNDLRQRERVGWAAASLAEKLLAPHTVLGLVWGTTVACFVNRLVRSNLKHLEIDVVQLVGAIASRDFAYSGLELVRAAAHALGGHPYYLNSPFYLENSEMVANLLKNKIVDETFQMMEKCRYAVVGIGSLAPELASFYLSGDISSEELAIIRKTGAIGSVCGLHFDIRGEQVAQFCSERTVTIQRTQLDQIPVRVGMACGVGKTEPILGALRGKFVTHLVTDSITARQVLELAYKS